MAEWSNAAVLKTVDLHGSGGSNPSLSARRQNEARGIIFDASCFFIAIGKLVWRMAIEKQGLPRSGSCREKPLASAPAASRRERRQAERPQGAQ